MNKDLVTGTILTQDGVLAYVALRMIIDESVPLYNKTKSVECVSVNRMTYLLLGKTSHEKTLTDGLLKGISELKNGELISIQEDLSGNKHYEYILDLSDMWLDTEKNKFVIVSPGEVHKIMTCREVMKKKISMLKYYIALISTFDWSLGSKIGHMSQQYIAEQAGNSIRTCQRYNEVLEEMQMIFVYKSNDKVRMGGKLKQIKNCYSRYKDKRVCEMYASDYENSYGVEHKIVATQKNKSQADNNRRLAAIYNQICLGNTDYDKETIKEVYKYIVNKNKSLQKDIDDKHKQSYISESDKLWIEKLESQMRETSIFEQFDFIADPKVSDDQWCESDPIIDFTIEEILEMPIQSSVYEEFEIDY